ncbi:MAG: flagellar hook-length control protein FliK [Pirellula sp.]|nr:flagellar hook-length control protein FliK [Pirellula sp.]
MSTENRVESKLSALVARRSFRQPIDNKGLGFQEELLSLSFESQTEFSESATEPTTSSSSVDQSQNSSDETNRAADEESERNEQSNQEFAFPLPLPQQPVNNTQPKLRDSETRSENPQGPELVKGAPSAEKLNSDGEGPANKDRVLSNLIDRGPSNANSEELTTDASNETTASLKSTKEFSEQNIANGQSESNQLTEADVNAAPSVDNDSSLKDRESENSTKKSSSDSKWTELTQESEVSDSNVVPVERVAKVEESVSSQDSLPNEQDAAPTRNRRVSRQDRIREENGSEAKRDSVESRQSQNQELAASRETEAGGQAEDSNALASQFDGIVVQASLGGSVETNYSVAGQAIAGPQETVVVNSASNAGVAGSSVTSALAASADSGLTADRGAMEPLVSGSGRGESAAAANRGAGRTEGATGSSALSRFQQNKLVQRVLKGLEQLSSGGGQVKLRLHPPELGTLQMTLKIEANVMSAHLEVENSLAKDALLNNLQSLRDKLSEQGMSIDRFEVEVRTDSQSGTSSSSGDSESNRQSRRDQPESRYAIYNENRLVNDNLDEGKRAVPWFRTTGKLDLSV